MQLQGVLFQRAFPQGLECNFSPRRYSSLQVFLFNVQLDIPYFNADPKKILIDLFRACNNARKDKSNTLNTVNLERHFKSSLFSLFDEIIEDRYEPKTSIWIDNVHNKASYTNEQREK